jgi:maltose O-acetyltransferase
MSKRRTLENYIRDMLINGCIASVLLPKPLRWRALRALGFDVSRSAIAPSCFFGSRRVQIGAGTSVSYRCFFDGLDWVRLGRNCDIAMEVLFITSDHEVGPPERRGGPSIKAPIVVGDGVWLGARVTILPGVTIGDGCIVGAGSLVTSDCPAQGVYAGSPARRLRDMSLSS